MALGAVLGAALTTPTSRIRGLFVGGVDVVFAPGGGGNRTGTPPETVEVDEKGPGGVSSMVFAIDDPGLAIAVADGMDVLFYDFVNDLPIFAGWVESWSVRPAFGNQGRTITVNAVGPESILDWAILPTAVTFTALGAGVSLGSSIQSLVAQASRTGPLRALAAAGLNSSQARPIDGNTLSVLLPADVTISAGTSLREAIGQLVALCGAAGYGYSGSATWAATVDFWYGLRVYPDDAAGSVASDYTSIVVNDVAPGLGPIYPAADLDYATEAAGPRAVFIQGGNAAGTGTVTDGSGLMGPTAYLEDDTILDAVTLARVGAAYLTQYQVEIRGSFVEEDILASSFMTAASGLRPGSSVNLTDARVGLAGESRKIYWIHKVFHAGTRETWTIGFGGLPPSGAALIRRLTRSTRS